MTFAAKILGLILMSIATAIRREHARLRTFFILVTYTLKIP